MAAPQLPDRYEILCELGSGGMGTVYKVKDGVLDKIFALKVLRIDFSSAPNDALRFQKEAKAAGNLRHKNIMAVIDFGVTETQTPYMVLEYVDGQTLKDVIQESGPLPIEEAVDVFEQIVGALHCAHSQGVVHRDLKSRNILLSTNEEVRTTVKLFDFGIAQIAESSKSIALTAPNAIIGTPAYMSPEQTRGGKVDNRSDIYSLGCVMYETLTGKLPFRSENSLELLDKHANTPAPNISLIVPELHGNAIEQAIAKCLNKNPGDRFQSVQDVLDAFAQYHEEKRSEPRAVPARATRSKAWIVAISALVLCAISSIGVTVSSVLHSSKSRNVPLKRAPDPPPEIAINPLDLESTGEIKLEKLLTEQNGLNLKACQTADAVIKSIPPGARIDQVNVSDSTITDDGLESLSKFTSITDLRAIGVTATARGIRALSKLTKLKYLDIRGADLSDEAFAEIANIKPLVNLHASKLNESQFTVLAKLPLLNGVNGTGTVLDEKSIKAMCTIKSLTYFVFDDCKQLDGAALINLRKMQHLGAIDIKKTPSICAHDDAGVKAISKVSRIDQLTLAEDELTDESVKYIAEMKNLKNLILYANHITDVGFKSLFKLKNLELLNVEQNPITIPTLRAFMRSHPNCKLSPKPPSANPGDPSLAPSSGSPTRIP